MAGLIVTKSPTCMPISCVIRGQSKHSHAVGVGKENITEGQKKEYHRAIVLHKKLQESSYSPFISEGCGYALRMRLLPQAWQLLSQAGRVGLGFA